MRTMLKVHIPVEAGSRAVRNGTLADTVQTVLDEITPEAAYLLPDDGVRSIYAVIDLADPTEISSALEPLFLELDARCELVPCMVREELQAGMAKAGPG